jgi:hypothetical protein
MTETMTTGGVFKGALAGGVAAGAVNVGLYVLGGAMGAKYMMVPPGKTEMEAIPLEMPFIMSVVPALLAAVALVALLKFAPAKAWQGFVGLLVVGFIGMAAGPFMQMGEDMVAACALSVMHVVVVAAIYIGVKKVAPA